MFSACLSPAFAADAPLILENGIPANSNLNYTKVDSGPINRGAITATENVWVNFTTDGDAIGAITAVNGETRYHVKLTSGSMTGNDGDTFEANNNQRLNITQPITAASLWILTGRVPLKSRTALDTVGTVYVAGGQLWFDGDGADAVVNNMVIGTSNYSGDGGNNYNKAAFRMDANASVNTVTVVSPAKLTFGNGKTMTFASLGGTGNLDLFNYGAGGTLKVNALSGYTGAFTVQNVTLEFGGAVTVLPKVTLTQDTASNGTATLKLNGPVTLAANTAFNSGVIDLSAVPLSDTTAAITIPDTGVTFAPGLTINLGTGRPANTTIRVFDAPADADYRAMLANLNITLNGKRAVLYSDGTIGSYPDIRSENNFDAQILHNNQDLWVNVSTAGGGINAGIDATGYNVKLTTGTMTGDPLVYTAQNWTRALKGPISAASISIENGRLSPSATGYLTNAGTVYLTGGHIYPSGAETFANDFVFNTSNWNEGNAYGNSVYRVDNDTKFNGTSTIRTDSKFSFGDSGLLTFAKLAGSGNITFSRYGNAAGRIVTVNDVAGYTGKIIVDHASFILKTTATPPVFTLASGTFAPSPPVALRSGTAFTGGIVDLSAVALNENTPAITIPAGASASFGGGAVIQLGASHALPVTLRLVSVESGASFTGWNPETASIVMGTIVPERTVNDDGTITFDVDRKPITFTRPSAYWEEDNKTAPVEALECVVPPGTSIGFGTEITYQQTIGGQESIVASVTGGGGYSSGGSPVATGSSEVTIKGGTFVSEIVAGGFGANASVGGDAILNVNGGVLADTVLRGSSEASTVGGLKRLRVSGERAVDLTATTVFDFNTVEVSDNATLTLGSATQVDAATVADGGTLVIAGQADAAENLRYIRLTVNDWPRSTFSNPNALAIAEFRLTKEGEAISWGADASIVTSRENTGNVNETSAKMIDGVFNSKYYMDPGGLSAFVFTITRGADAGEFDGYEIYAADQNGRNPLNWTLSGSTDGTHWVVLDQRRLSYVDVTSWTWAGCSASAPGANQRKAFTCARTALLSGIDTVTVADGGTLTGSGKMIGDLVFESGSTLLKTSTDSAFSPWVSGTISGSTTVVGPELELTAADKQYLLVGPGAVAATPSAFVPADSALTVRRDATGLYLTKKSGILIMIY